MTQATPSPVGPGIQIKYSGLVSIVLLAGLAAFVVVSAKNGYESWTAAPTLTLPDTVKGKVGEIIQVKATGSATDVHWHTHDKGLNVSNIQIEDGNVALVTSANPGNYTLSAHGAHHSKTTPISSVKVVVTPEVGPVPPGPSPDPTPGPTPPGPTPPTPNPAPIPGDGLHVLMVYDKAKEKSMPEAQAEILYGDAIRQYLNDKGAMESDGMTKSWRIWYSTINASNELPVWKDALARKRGTMPWIIISNGKTGFEGPLPADVQSTLTLLKTYGG